MDQRTRKPYPAWLENAVFYQIYPQSFYDSNGDGIGDLAGIFSKLDYLQSLGISACWLNPCFESPFQDAGYDISNYYRVAGRYGTNADLEQLFQAARERGIRILLDLVPGHTSIQHPWFKESCQSQANRFSDYYIWTDNVWNWEVRGQRVVAGYAERNGSYLTNFFYFQPALNYGFANPDPKQPWQQAVDAPGPLEVRLQLKEIIRFWLEKGASGFRVDMASSLVKGDYGYRQTSKIWQEIREWLDVEFPDAVLVSEWGEPAYAIPAGFHVDFLLPSGTPGYTALFRKPYGRWRGNDPYGFSFFDSAGNGNIMEFLDDYLFHYQKIKDKGLIAIPTGNHDINPRLSKNRSEADLELIFIFLLTMPGIPFIYYGDEIGMHTFDELPSKEGGYERTGVRTPMQWSNELNAGFSTASPDQLYLPVDPSPDRPNVTSQEQKADSLLQKVRRLVAIRKSHRALQASADLAILFAQAGKYPLVYQRQDENHTFIVALNPSHHPSYAEFSFDSVTSFELIYGKGSINQTNHNTISIQLPGVAGGIFILRKT
jgi:glycosidase